MNRIALIALVGLLSIGAAAGQQPPPLARAAITDARGKAVGRVTLTQMPKGVLIRAELADLPPGWHGLHVHEIGECAPPFSSAGAQGNAGGEKHGLIDGSRHAGDLPNVHVDADGRAMAEMITPDLALSEATATGSGIVDQMVRAVRNAVGVGTVNLLDANGSAIVVHAKADDYRTDPAGDSGDRIACGVITRS
jgi:superoxide dismutase, Cu-Zn family